MIMAPMAEIPRSQPVAVVVLSWNGKDDTLQCLASLAGVDYEPLEVIVVDNGSSDGSPEAVEAEFPEAVVIRMGRNAGFSGGVNAGIEAAIERGAAAVLLLNNDMVVEPGFLGPLVAAASSPASRRRAARSCSPSLPTGSGTRERRSGRGAAITAATSGSGRHRYPRRRRPTRSTAPAAAPCSCRARPSTRSASSTSELFAYREDLDWSLRAARAGRRVVVVPASIVRHRISASTGGESSPTSLYYDVRNGLVVSERYAPLGRVRHLAPPRRVGPGAPGAGRDVPSPRRGDACGAGRLARCAAPAPRPPKTL